MLGKHSRENAYTAANIKRGAASRHMLKYLRKQDLEFCALFWTIPVVPNVAVV
jgi:hypothetical protein